MRSARVPSLSLPSIQRSKIRAISNAVSTGVGRIDLATPDSVMQQPAESPADKSVDKSNRRLAAAGGSE
jgi:hypothetical protein